METEEKKPMDASLKIFLIGYIIAVIFAIPLFFGTLGGGKTNRELKTISGVKFSINNFEKIVITNYNDFSVSIAIIKNRLGQGVNYYEIPPGKTEIINKKCPGYIFTIDKLDPYEQIGETNCEELLNF